MAEDLDLGFLCTNLPNYYLEFNDLFQIVHHSNSYTLAVKFGKIKEIIQKYTLHIYDWKKALVIATSNITC